MNLLSASVSTMFIFSARNFHPRRIWYEKPEPKTGTRKRSRFMAPVSAALRSSSKMNMIHY